MASEEKRFELKPIDEIGDLDDEPVVRLEKDATKPRSPSGRAEVAPDDAIVSRRLVLPSRGEFETRTHQPGIEALIEAPTLAVNPLEGNWGKAPVEPKKLPWGWVVLIGIALIGGIGWSLSRVKHADVQAHEIRETTKSVLTSEAEEKKKAGELIDRIEAAKVAFFSAATVDELARVVRQPERVRPLLEDYYSKHPRVPHRIEQTRNLIPQTIDKRGNFWTSTVELDDKTRPSLVLEVLDSGEAKIDWETFVCYQPLDWSAYAADRPVGKSYEFRVYLEADNLFSHEFADSKQWNCFRLTALNSIETLFGYVRTDNPLSGEIIELIRQNRGQKVSLILRVSIPEGLQSRRGVVIEKVMASRWLYLDPPDSGS